MSADIDLERVVARVRKTYPDVLVEQTGGGTATIMVYANETLPENRALIAAGPGWFTGPNWTKGRASRDEFYVGLDEDTGDLGEYLDPALTDDEIADYITEMAGAVHQNQLQGWRNVEADAIPHWAR